MSSVTDYLILTKPKVMMLIAYSAFAGMVISPSDIHPVIALVSLLSICLASGSAAAFNMWYDRDIDLMMTRTQNRPIVCKRISPDDGLSFSFILGIFSITIMSVFVNYIAGILTLISIIIYAYIYTVLLKRNSSQNIVIGGISGAMPPIIGYYSTNIMEFNAYPFILALFIFLWTPPHFWALSIIRIEEYKKCQIPMLPVIYGEKTTKQSIIIYSIIMVLISLAPYFLKYQSIIYFILACFLGYFFLFLSYRTYQNNNDDTDLQNLFKYSIFYMFAILTIIILDTEFKSYAIYSNT